MAKFYITAAIDYVNGKPHLGTAYEKITADVIARYKRLAGFDVHFVMGNDEHSIKVLRQARERGQDPLAYCDEMEQVFRDAWKKLDVSFDDFIRTTEERHKKGVTKLFGKFKPEDVYQGEYEGPYCVGCESFKVEADLDEDGNCKIHKTKPDQIKEKNYFFRLSKYQEPLLELYQKNPGLLQPATRRNEILNMIKDGLPDVSISRESQEWGVPLPQDPKAVVYVWYDALINYISAVGYGHDEASFKKWWPADLHIIGKDITKFHSIYWPAMLMSAGVELPLAIFGHGWVLFEGEKMSKSDGTVVDPLEAADKYGPDALRYYLVREIVYGSDGNFSWARFEERYNADLANNFGNLVNRIAGMAAKYRDGDLPQPSSAPGKLAKSSETSVSSYKEAMDKYALADAAKAVFKLLAATNEFITETEPWALAKDENKADELSQVLYEVAEAIRIAAILLTPIMPGSCAKILERIGAPADSTLADALWNAAGGRKTQKGDALWPRLESEKS